MKRKVLCCLAVLAGCGLLLLAGAILAVPYVAERWRYPSYTWDLSSLGAAFTNQTATAQFAVRKAAWSGCDVRMTGQAAGLDYALKVFADFDWSWRGPQVKGTAMLTVPGSKLRLDGTFAARGAHDWQAEVALRPVDLAASDVLIRRALELTATNLVATLTATGNVSCAAKVRMTPRVQVPVWEVNGRIDGLCAELATEGDPLELKGFRLKGQVGGIGDYVDWTSLRPRIDRLACGKVAATNLTATLVRDDHRFLVTEARARCCGGTVRLYSLFLDPKSLDAGVTLFLDDLDAGELLACWNGFKGVARGRLHGKMPVSLRGGRHVRIRSSYLYSTPGEHGALALEDASPVTDNLALSGLSEADCANVALALRNLDYSVLKFDFRPAMKDGEDGTLSLQIEGTSTAAGKTVPVAFDVTWHSDFESLLNFGLRVHSKVQ